MALTYPKSPFSGLIFIFQALQIQNIGEIQEKEFEQSVPGYDPQLVARLSLSHATIVYRTACGSRLNRDVGCKKYE